MIQFYGQASVQFIFHPATSKYLHNTLKHGTILCRQAIVQIQNFKCDFIASNLSLTMILQMGIGCCNLFSLGFLMFINQDRKSHQKCMYESPSSTVCNPMSFETILKAGIFLSQTKHDSMPSGELSRGSTLQTSLFGCHILRLNGTVTRFWII